MMPCIMSASFSGLRASCSQTKEVSDGQCPLPFQSFEYDAKNKFRDKRHNTVASESQHCL